MLEARALHAYYGRSHILRDVSLNVAAGETVALLGRNGAGKTTTLRTISGLLQPKSGSVDFAGATVTRLPAYRRAHLGLVLAPSGRRCFADLTVSQNMQLAARSGSRWTQARVLELFPPLGRLLQRPAGTLSGGEQQMLKIARALLLDPRVLMLDEPTEGLAPIVVAELMAQLRTLKAAGIGLLVTDHNPAFAQALADRAYLLVKGTVHLEASRADLHDGTRLRELLSV